MRSLGLGVILAGWLVPLAALAADPAAAPPPKRDAAKAAPAAPEAPSRAGEITGWGEPLPADLEILERLEGENLDEARKQGRLAIQGARKDLNGDGIPELFFYVDNPYFCWKGEGCTVIVLSRASLSDPWRMVGALVAPTPSVMVLGETASEFPALKAIGARTYGWNGSAYEPRSPAPPEVMDELEGE